MGYPRVAGPWLGVLATMIVCQGPFRAPSLWTPPHVFCIRRSPMSLSFAPRRHRRQCQRMCSAKRPMTFSTSRKFRPTARIRSSTPDPLGAVTRSCTTGLPGLSMANHRVRRTWLSKTTESCLPNECCSALTSKMRGLYRHRFLS